MNQLHKLLTFIFLMSLFASCASNSHLVKQQEKAEFGNPWFNERTIWNDRFHGF